MYLKALKFLSDKLCPDYMLSANSFQCTEKRCFDGNKMKLRQTLIILNDTELTQAEFLPTNGVRTEALPFINPSFNNHYTNTHLKAFIIFFFSTSQVIGARSPLYCTARLRTVLSRFKQHCPTGVVRCKAPRKIKFKGLQLDSSPVSCVEIQYTI